MAKCSSFEASAILVDERMQIITLFPHFLASNPLPMIAFCAKSLSAREHSQHISGTRYQIAVARARRRVFPDFHDVRGLARQGTSRSFIDPLSRTICEPDARRKIHLFGC